MTSLVPRLSTRLDEKKKEEESLVPFARDIVAQRRHGNKYTNGSHYIRPFLGTEVKNEHVVSVSHPLICSRPREIRTRSC